MNNQRFLSKYRQQGFTLIEIMVVVAIIGLLLAVVAPNIIGSSDEAKIVKAQADIQSIENALTLYRLDNGFYPSQEQGLEALVKEPTTPPIPKRYKKGGYIRKLPEDDPWGNPYQYRNPGTHGEVDVFSYGPKGEQGGPENEIGNW